MRRLPLILFQLGKHLVALFDCLLVSFHLLVLVFEHALERRNLTLELFGYDDDFLSLGNGSILDCLFVHLRVVFQLLKLRLEELVLSLKQCVLSIELPAVAVPLELEDFVSELICFSFKLPDSLVFLHQLLVLLLQELIRLELLLRFD